MKRNGGPWAMCQGYDGAAPFDVECVRWARREQLGARVSALPVANATCASRAWPDGTESCHWHELVPMDDSRHGPLPRPRCVLAPLLGGRGELSY